MSFKITIIETRRVKREVGQKWDKIDQVEKVREEKYFGTLWNDADKNKTYIADVMGYTPLLEKEVDEERKVLEQEVDKLDLSAVIKAVNGL